MLTIPEIKKAVETIAPEYPIKQVQLFGSYADGFATEKSDVDVLVEFGDRPISIWACCGFQQALSDMLDIKVDMIRLPLSKQTEENILIQKVVQLYG